MTPLEHDAGSDRVSIGEGVWALAGTILGLLTVAAAMLWSVGQ
jgi:hypothetical protein